MELPLPQPGLEPAFALEWMPVVWRETAAPKQLGLERMTLRPGQFSRGAERPVFVPSGRQKRTKPGQPASRSVFGVLQLAYFSMRYGLPSGVNAR